MTMPNGTTVIDTSKAIDGKIRIEKGGIPDRVTDEHYEYDVESGILNFIPDHSPATKTEVQRMITTRLITFSEGLKERSIKDLELAYCIHSDDDMTDSLE